MGAPSVFLPAGTEVVDGKIVSKPTARWAHRTDGQRASKKCWLCRACWAWHDPPKPLICQVCNHSAFFRCDSAGEGRWFAGRLRAMERGEITELVHHPAYEIYVHGPDGVSVKVFLYEADAEWTQDGKVTTADFKAKLRTNATTKAKREIALDPIFKLKRKCFEATYGRRILIITEK